MHHAITDRVIAAHVRAVAAVHDAGDVLHARVDRLRQDGEQGAQAAEYAMLGGVSAAACSGLIYLLREPGTLERVVGAVVDGLARAVRLWF